MSLRLAKINENLRREISLVILEHYSNKWGVVVVSDVQISADYKFARVWVIADESTINKLNEAGPEISKRLKPRLVMRHIPRLTFLPETNEIDHVEELLEKI